MISLARVPSDYKHPAGWQVGEWGIYEDGRLIIAGSYSELRVYFNKVLEHEFNSNGGQVRAREARTPARLVNCSN